MDGREIAVMLVLAAMGVYCIKFGWDYRTGKNRKPYFATNRRYTYLAVIGIPAGIFWFSLVAGMFIGFFFPETKLLANLTGFIISLGIGAGLLGWLVSFFPKSFMHPNWVKWMREKHGDIMRHLQADAREMGLDAWNERVRSQRRLEEWCKEVRKKAKADGVYV